MVKKSYRSEFRNQKMDAHRRGIEFKFTYEDWLAFWKKSGKLAKRGCKRGQYCMARFGDKGPYEIGNVKIILHSDNCREQQWSEERRKRHGELARGNKSNLGRRFTAEHRHKQSLARKRWWQRRRKLKPAGAADPLLTALPPAAG